MNDDTKLLFKKRGGGVQLLFRGNLYWQKSSQKGESCRTPGSVNKLAENSDRLQQRNVQMRTKSK